MATSKPNLNRVWASGAPGTNVVDPDTTTPGKFAAGWQAEVPPFEHFNYLQQLFTQGLAYNNEQGINEWDGSTVYPIAAIVKGSNGDLYFCVSENSGNDPTLENLSFWKNLSLNVDLKFKTVSDLSDGNPEYVGQLTENQVSNLASENREISVVWNNLTTKAGKANYILWTLTGYRDEIEDPSWVPDGNKDHYFFNNNYVAVYSGSEINTYQLGVIPDGTTDSSSNVNSFGGKDLTVIKGSSGIKLNSPVLASFDKKITGDRSIRQPHFITNSDFGVQGAIELTGTSTLSNLYLKGSDNLSFDLAVKYPSTSGRGVSMIGTNNKQWYSIRDMFIEGYDVGIYNDSVYYGELYNANVHKNNTGIRITDATESAVGSTPMIGAHIRNNIEYGIHADGANDQALSDCVFEFNRTHIFLESGSLMLEGCYLADGPWQVARVTGGVLTIDQRHRGSWVGSGGNPQNIYFNTNLDPKVDYHCGGFEVSNGGLVEIKNARVTDNIYSNIGVSFGTRDNGSDYRCTTGGRIAFYNTITNSYFPVSYDSDAGCLRNGDKLNNYFINGLFDRNSTLQYDITGASSATIASPEENPFSKHKVEITGTGNFSYGCRYSVPKSFVGKKMAMCLLTGTATGISNRNFVKNGFTVVGPNVAETSSSFWVAGGVESVSMAWYTVEISASEGAAVLSGTIAGAHEVNLYGFILTELENFQKLGDYQESWARRVSSAAPTIGTWDTGDTFENSSPASSATKFVCTSGGDSGTWITE